VTGESEPEPKEPGALLYAGGRQVGEAIELEVVREVSQSYLTQLWNYNAFQKADTSRIRNLLGWQRPLAIGCGVVLLISFVWRNGLPTRLRWPWLNGQITQVFSQGLQQPGWANFAGLGVLNGLLPCGYTYLALAGTLASHTSLTGAAYMLAFGLGTLPALSGINLVAGWLIQVGRQRLNRVLSIATVVVALLLIGRGLVNYRLPANTLDAIPLCHELLT